MSTATAADIMNHKFDFDEHRQGCEASYHRGVHQALALAGDLVDRAETLGEARRVLTRAENVASMFRFVRKREGNGMLLDAIRQRLARRTRAN